MSHGEKLFVAILGVFLSFLVLAVTSANYAKKVSCHAQWAGSGMNVRYSFAGGCQVQRKNGTWVPSSMLRETEN